MRISVKRLSGISESYQKNLISFKNIGFSLRFGHNSIHNKKKNGINACNIFYFILLRRRYLFIYLLGYLLEERIGVYGWQNKITKL